MRALASGSCPKCLQHIGRGLHQHKKSCGETEADMLARMEQFIHPEPNSGCWLWRGAVSDRGYGTTVLGKKRTYAHRAMYELCLGPIPPGLQIDHLCRTTICVNPKHLEAVTRRENCLRGEAPNWRAVRTNICKRGHELTQENTRVLVAGYRVCRACEKIRNAARVRT